MLLLIHTIEVGAHAQVAQLYKIRNGLKDAPGNDGAFVTIPHPYIHTIFDPQFYQLCYDIVYFINFILHTLIYFELIYFHGSIVLGTQLFHNIFHS